MNDKLREKALASGVLDKDYHDRLLLGIEKFTRSANIPVEMVYTGMSNYCTEEEIDYVSNLKTQSEAGNFGLLYIGTVSNVTIHDRMMAVAGACLRNYVNAKVMTVQNVLADIKHDRMTQPTVLLISNFLHSKNDGGNVAEWEVASLLGLLYARQGEGLQTFLYAQSLELLESQYGVSFKKHIEMHFKITTA